jgi:hypothetical protein
VKENFSINFSISILLEKIIITQQNKGKEEKEVEEVRESEAMEGKI